MMDSTGCLAVPSLQTGSNRPHCDMSNGIKVVIILGIPHITHRRMAVTDMKGSSAAYSFSDRVARTHYEIERAQIEGFDSRRKQRKEISIIRVDAGNPIQPGRCDRV